MLTPLLIAAVGGYLLGSLPFGYLVARAKGVNIFEVGSKSPGATNVRRVLGSGPGNLVLLLDALKGAAAAGWPLLVGATSARTLSQAHDGREPVEGWFLAAGNVTLIDSRYLMLQATVGLIAAILGHSFSCFTKFRGGKSVATAAGGFLVLFPIGMAIALAVFGLTVAVTRYISLGSMLGAVSLPVTALVTQRSTVLVSVTAAVALFVVLRHRANISRLLAGTENKIGQKKPISSVPPAAPASKS